ncbi:MAG: cysteine dioxygenase family protein [Chloroflexi bacterium]|nr:cysteine dioxygenase family protein [Chloroflexota bacterium]
MPAGEYYVDSPRLREFIEAVEELRRRIIDPPNLIAAIRPFFVDLLADQTWLPARYQETAEHSGMGRGIGTWLLYRSADRGLAFSSLVVPPGASTPIHDHLAWGLVGLYRGEQEEEIFTRRDTGPADDRAVLDIAAIKRLRPGDLYTLLPENDIHRVRTISAITSVSLHLLGNDNGCIWRHRFIPEEERIEPFRSGYLNAPCTETVPAEARPY